MVRRRPHPGDGRRVLLSLTAKARTLMEEVFPQFNAQESDVLSTLTPTEREVLTQALRKIVLHLEVETSDDDRPGTAPRG